LETADKALGRALMLNCLTNISIHSIKRYVETSEPLQVYRADSEGVRVAILSSCVRCRRPKGEFVIQLDDLSSFLQRASRGYLYVQIPLRTRPHKQVLLSADFLKKAVEKRLKLLIDGLVKMDQPSPTIFEAKLMGDIADRLT
jgi:hypothetical protein